MRPALPGLPDCQRMLTVWKAGVFVVRIVLNSKGVVV
jgi:hypothetical protein